MSVFFRFIYWLIYICFFCDIGLRAQNVQSIHHVSNVELRTSVTQPVKNNFYIAVDFKVPFGSHITAPEGAGKAMAPLIKLENCKILKIKWPKSVPIMGRDGQATEYVGFYKDFTVILEVSINDITKPINYDIFYVYCNKGCTPCQMKGILQYNGKLNDTRDTRKLISRKSSEQFVSQKIEKLKDNNLSTMDTKQHKTSKNTQDLQNKKYGILYNILIGLLGGLILNIMPCVFPVISIKLLSIMNSAGQLPRLIRKQCFAYSAGTIFMFLMLWLVICIVRTKIPVIGWGFYMQIPQFIFVLLMLFLFCALHFLDIYRFHISIPQVKFLRTQNANLCIKSFVNGIFGAITSAVCVGPFLGLPIGTALLSEDTFNSIILFASIGGGLALPFLFMGFFPSYISRFPKISEKTLRALSLVLGTLMLLSCAWLISVLTVQMNNPGMIMFIIMVLIVISVLLYSIQHVVSNKTMRAIFILLLIFLGISGYVAVNNLCHTSVDQSNKKASINWHRYDGTLPKQRPLFIKFTASWCLNCQFNNRIFNDNDIIKLFNDNEIYAIECDWTTNDNKISELLSSFGSVAVPFYVYYPPKGNPKILPTILTKSNIIEFVSGK